MKKSLTERLWPNLLAREAARSRDLARIDRAEQRAEARAAARRYRDAVERVLVSIIREGVWWP